MKIKLISFLTLASLLLSLNAFSYDPKAKQIAVTTLTGGLSGCDDVQECLQTASTLTTAGASAPLAATYITQTANSSLTNEQALGSLATGIVKNTTSTGVLSIAASGTDYAPATSGSTILKGNGSGGFSSTAAGTDYVAPNGAITGATKTKVTYDSKGLVTAGADATTSDIAEGSNLYYTTARVLSATNPWVADIDADAYDLIDLDNVEVNSSIKDSNLKKVLSVSPTTNGDNYLQITNAAIGTNASLTATGVSSDIGISLIPKGTGSIDIEGSLPTVLSDGDFGYDNSTQQAWKVGASGMAQTLSGVIFTSTADKTVDSTVTETSLIGTGVGSTTLPSNFLVSGKNIRVRIRGKIGNTSTPTIRIRAKLGSVSVVDTGAVTMSTITGTNYFEMDFSLTCRSVGVSGTVYGQGEMKYFTSSSAASAIAAASTSATTIDTTAFNAIDITAEWGTSSSSNTITATNTSVEILN